MLPIQPSVAKFMGKNVPSACHRKTFAQIDGLCVGIPNSIGILIPFVHLYIGELPHSNPITEWKHHTEWNPQLSLPFFHNDTHSPPHLSFLTI